MAAFFATFGVIADFYNIRESIMFILFITLFMTYLFFINHIWVISSKIKKILQLKMNSSAIKE